MTNNHVKQRLCNKILYVLFNNDVLLKNEIIKIIKTRREYRIGTKEINCICYADDAIIMTRSESNLHRLLNHLHSNKI